VAPWLAQAIRYPRNITCVCDSRRGQPNRTELAGENFNLRIKKRILMTQRATKVVKLNTTTFTASHYFNCSYMWHDVCCSSEIG